MATVPVYCECRQPYDAGRFMIECDVCKDWFHGSCVRVEEHQAVDIDLYHCPKCAILHGASLMKRRKNWHRHDYTEVTDSVKMIQAGTPVFVRHLRARHFPSAGGIVIKMHGTQLTHKYLEKHGFDFPILVPKIDGLGIALPSSTFSVRDLEEYVGGEKVIDVIDVARQADCKMKLREFVEYYNAQRTKVLNVISLEFSDTKMSDLVKVPDIVQKLSWVENYWPEDSIFPKPCVQKYCLMGMEDSYTDFHIDFGGTSVWYHVLWGDKIFYLIKPTNANLALYESWSSSVNQSETFFGDQVDRCYKCVLQQGQTLLIPTGWIHAVLTSKDCMAFGGNFLHNLNIGTQLRIYEMEKRLKTPELFKFPYFEAMCWYVANGLWETLKEMREDDCQPQEYLVQGVKLLIPSLKCWIQREGLISRTSELPDQIRPGHLIKELSKEVRFVEEMNIGNKPVKSQGIVPAVPVTRISQDKNCSFSINPSKRKCRRLRDPSNKMHSNLDILELHTRQVLKKMEMAPWNEDDMSSSTLRVKLSGTSSPSSTAAEKGCSGNNLQLVLSKGRIISHGRNKVMKSEHCSASSEDEEEEQTDEQSSVLHEENLQWEDQKPASQTPLNKFFESVKIEIQDGTSESSEQYNSDDMKEEYSIQKLSSWDEGFDQSSDSGKNDLTNNSLTGKSHQVPEKPRTSLKRCKKDSMVERVQPPSPSTTEAIQGMLSMAALQYSDLRNSPRKNRDSLDKRNLSKSHHGIRTNRREKGELSPCSRASDCAGPGKQEAAECSTVLMNSETRAIMGTTARLSEEILKNELKHLRKECSSMARQNIQENKILVEEMVDSEGQIASDSLGAVYRSTTDCGLQGSPVDNGDSPDWIHPGISTSPPLHPSSKTTISNPPPVSNQATKGKRPKKGMATAKQRLGKILKLNRSGRLFL
ncbi:lysine-specific demethylase 7A isoform X1 [Amblyraja radiata]|uniref:lysine-specific demethylase 7A isoform X1 n=1 Tax=Amblyraja radiata TaxID=386614 RepID=UPI001403AC23|nr:lysine-specific demethylase 7A isoform X1 [Amblyraja radiata]